MLKCCLGTKIKNCQRGAVIVLFALMLPVLFGFMGLGIDVGLAYVEKGKVQDIADSAALAGAAKLSADGNNDMDAIKTAVESYVKANGISLGENDMLRKDADKWDDKETLAAGQDALVAYGVVTFADGETPDRVRVRITKRIPSFFVNVLGDFSDGFVVVAKAAAEGAGEEPIIVSRFPLIMANSALDIQNINKNKVTFEDGMDVTVIANNDFDLSKLPNGTYISTQEKNKQAGQVWGYVYWTEDAYNWYPKEEDKAIVTKALEAIKGRTEANQLGSERLNAALSKKAEFMAGNSDPNSNKRYIDKDNPIIKNPKNGIDLYIKAQAVSGSLYSGGVPLLTDRMLNGVAYIKNIYIEGEGTPVIDTNEKYYGNIYSNNGVSINGKKNHFNGFIYDLGGNIYVSGDRNVFFDRPDSDVYGILASTVSLGYGYDVIYSRADKTNEVIEPGNPIAVTTKLGPAKNGSKIYFGNVLGYHGKPPYEADDNPGSGTGSGGSSGSTTIGKLRLVE